VLAAVKAYPHDFRDTCLRLFSDNTGVVHCINNGYSKSPPIRVLLRELFELLHTKHASITASYIKGEDNVVADKMSRMSLGDNWRLHTKLFE
jgi:hypothetical protein